MICVFGFTVKGYQFVGIDQVLHHWRDSQERISRTWEEYKDNRYFELKLGYFYPLDRDMEPALWWSGEEAKTARTLCD